MKILEVDYAGKHICNRFCYCPVHESKMMYSPSEHLHACIKIKCKYAHGYENKIVEEMKTWKSYIG